MYVTCDMINLQNARVIPKEINIMQIRLDYYDILYVDYFQNT